MTMVTLVAMVVSKGKLKGKMLEYFRQVEATGEPLIVTDRGREVLEVRVLKPKTSADDALARLREKAKLLKPITDEELMAPAVDWREWGQDEVWLEDK